MSLVQWKPRNTDAFQELLNDDLLFAPFLPASALGRGNNQFLPALDVAEDNNSYTIKADLPGLKKEDVHLSFDNGVLTIEGERKSEEEKREKNYHRIERSYGKFVRSLNLGAQIASDKIQANYKDGVLTITAPKADESKRKAIDIHLG